ncbi:3-oxoacyl-ACP synthase III family protein [Azospirillum doebereinerae]|uniref:Ketoacyl-ACP synthase III n=1 Tax=Azospirillum doebereinerae TaxID=92933 RepID=A0A433J6R5_9PROT|nr:ketoacyl-ACP synthase III [Azospirillum doebereinerae]RUQ68891.1 ketoacyl-ACP synthase III [Azospirillum doebereinerae]
MKAIVDGVRIAGLRAVVPPQRHSFVEDPGIFTPEEVRKLAATIGVHERRVLPPPYCASDLCVAAAEGLMAQLDWDPASVEVLVFVSQDADYVLPATACIMQKRLGLPTSAAAFDVPLGCSGYVYGLWIASRLLGGSTAKRALVLCGDNATRHLHPEDRATLPLFGDAGSATALEVDPDATPMPVVIGTDGAGAPHIFVKAGGKRHSLIPPVASAATARDPEAEARLERESRLTLNGAEVFAFTLRAVPPLLRETLEHAGTDVDGIDWFVLHQANAFMLEHLRKRVKAPAGKFVIDMQGFGNTSSASIPLAICNGLGASVATGRRRTLMAGFGVGWSWGAMVADIGPIPEPRVVDLPEGYPVLVV